MTNAEKLKRVRQEQAERLQCGQQTYGNRKRQDELRYERAQREAEEASKR